MWRRNRDPAVEAAWAGFLRFAAALDEGSRALLATVPSARRLVGVEIFNKTHDYLFQGTDGRAASPLLECLGAGWRASLLGSTDEHGGDWGVPDGKGRAGLWVHELTRAGVWEALLARRMFASRVKGLRLDAACAGVRMGGTVPLPEPRPLRVELDLDRGAAWWGRRLNVQVLRPGPAPGARLAEREARRLPALAAAVEVTLPSPREPVVSFEVDVDPAGGPWLVLRVSDLSAPPDPAPPGRGPSSATRSPTPAPSGWSPASPHGTASSVPHAAGPTAPRRRVGL